MNTYIYMAGSKGGDIQNQGTPTLGCDPEQGLKCWRIKLNSFYGPNFILHINTYLKGYGIFFFYHMTCVFYTLNENK